MIIGDLADGVVSHTENTITEEGLTNSSAKWVDAGSVLVAMYGSIGKLAIAGCRLTTNQAIAFAQSDVLEHKYLFWYLASIRPRLQELGKGGTQQNISQTVLKAVPVPVAPLAEQRRIVAALEEHLPDLDAAVAGLQRAKVNCARLKRATADSLVAPEPAPAAWTRASVAEISISIQYGHTASAREGAGPRFLRITDIQNDQVDWSLVPTCDVSERELERYRLTNGDLLFARTGATTGKSYLVSTPPLALFASYLIRLRLRPDVHPRFVALFFRTSAYWQQIESGKRGIGQPNVNAAVLSELTLRLPPYEEQVFVATCVETRLSAIDRTAAEIEIQLARAVRLRQSILRRAFEGKLVPQTQSDEPASDLLARFRHRPAPATTGGRGRRRPSPATGAPNVSRKS